MFTSIRFLLGAAVGAAGGYAFGRIVEARTMRVPLADAFKLENLLVPVSRLPSSTMPLKPPTESPGLFPYEATLMPREQRLAMMVRAGR